MSIIQISKIQQRSGNIVDLPQLDEAEFGWASDTKQLFIGKTTPNENIEVLTSYSQINFDQINGSVGNLNISNTTVADGQVLAYDGNNWVNRGGNVGGLINLGEVSNVRISGGAIGYVLETDGLGNLSWTPKSSIIAFIQNVTKANPAEVTTTQDNFFTDGTKITITGAQGMTQLDGQTYYANVTSANTFTLYSDVGLTTAVDTTGGGFSTYTFTSAASTTASTNVITVGDSSLFSLDQEVEFSGSLGNSSLENNTPYYIKTKPTSTSITVSATLLANGTAGDVKPLVTATLTGANVYATGGRVIATVSGGGGSTAAAGTLGSIQFYGPSGILAADPGLSWNASTGNLNASGNVNTGNVNATGIVTAPQLTSNIATGTAPLTVTSTTRVANLNVNHANVSDFGVVTNQTTGTFFPVFVNGSTTGNRALGANANISFNAATGALISTLYTGTITTNAQPNITSLGTLTSLDVNGTITAPNITANTGVFTGNASGLTAINAGNLSSGTVPTARLSGSYAIAAATVTTNAQPNITSVGTLTGLTVGNATANAVFGNGTITLNSGLITGNGNGLSSIVGANVTGEVAFAATANAVAGANVSGAVLFAATANAVAGANVTGEVAFAATANAVAGANVSGAVAFATTANAVAGANVSGAVAFATTANAVAGANVSGIVGNATTVIGATQNNITTLGALTTLSTGASGTSGSITGNWTLTSGSRMQATYADLAEYYEADAPYEPGTVLMFGGEKEVTIADDGTSKVAGVVSTNPAYVMNSTCPGLLTAIALQGRVPCKVRGKISKGDMLISGGSGFARPNQFPSVGTVIGKALEDFDGYEGVIEVAVGRL
jgi:hypothetical protein